MWNSFCPSPHQNCPLNHKHCLVAYFFGVLGVVIVQYYHTFILATWFQMRSQTNWNFVLAKSLVCVCGVFCTVKTFLWVVWNSFHPSPRQNCPPNHKLCCVAYLFLVFLGWLLYILTILLCWLGWFIGKLSSNPVSDQLNFRHGKMFGLCVCGYSVQ